MDNNRRRQPHLTNRFRQFLHQVNPYTCGISNRYDFDNAIISALGTALGRGTLISIVIVMMVLPQIVLLCDKFIEKTAFGKKATDDDKAAKREMSGIMFVNGRVRGHVSGFMDGVFYGLVKGDIDAKVELGNQQDLLLTESKEDNIKIDESRRMRIMRTTKKNNKIISFLTALVIMLNILPMCIVQADDTVAISTVNDLKDFFEKCVYDEYSKNKKFVLQKILI